MTPAEKAEITPLGPGQITPLRVLSLGAGVQSTTLLLMAVEGVLPKPDLAIFADTGWEPKRVYDHLDRLTGEAEAAGVPVVHVSKGNLRDDHLDPDNPDSSMPLFVRGSDGREAMARRTCTSNYKLAPIYREIRRLLGAKPPDYMRVPRGNRAELWVGFSTDEIGRVGASRVQYVRNRHPLLELGMSRRDCLQWLAERGWGDTPKSACVGCPFHGNRMWRDMRDNHPEEWADAVEFDHAIRTGPKGTRSQIKGEQFLHRSLLPLDEADLRSKAQIAADAGQTSMFDVDEDGDPDGCSPFACRSGEPVVIDESDEGAA